MGLLFSVVIFIVGFVLLVLGADFLVKGAESLAKRLALAEIVIGLTIVAFGTSTPELIVNIFSSIKGSEDIVFGNIIGSNIFNILIILGISGLICPLVVHRNTVWKEIPFSLFAVLLLFVLINDVALFGARQNRLAFIDGIILLLFFAIFMFYIFGISKIQSSDTMDVKVYTLAKTSLLIVIGFACLFVGGRMVVDNAILIARSIQVSEKMIALTIVAGGTSLPELATSVVAAVKKKHDIAIGNVVGSNIFNICFILGISALIRPTPYHTVLNLDLAVLFLATVILFLTMFTGRIHRLDRLEAIVFILMYVGYLIYLFSRL